MYATESVRAFLGRCQKRMDQELDHEANLWTLGEMLEYANEGVREVWQAVRETHQNWGLREMTSQDGVLKIGGRDYDTSFLRLIARRTRLLLPPDFQELLFIEGIPPTASAEIPDTFFPNVVFEYRNITQRAFREDALDVITTNRRRYLYDVVFSPSGPYILVSPPLSLDETIDTKIMYLATPGKLRLDDTFEGFGFSEDMVDALLMYVCYAAAHKEKLIENLETFGSAWSLKKELVQRTAGPKQTRDEELVEGFLEEEL